VLQLTNIFLLQRPYIALLPIFIKEWKYKFQVVVSKNEAVFFFLLHQKSRPSEVYPQATWVPVVYKTDGESVLI
jgi:hypothetical protein